MRAVGRVLRLRRLLVSSTDWKISWILGWIFCCSLPGLAQYSGHIDAKKEKPPVLRAVAVLEWVGEPGKPSASRIVPISVFDGKTYQDGGIYKASPAPLAIDGDTEYQLLRAGVPQGTFDVFSAGDVDGFWYGYGVWKPLHEATPPKLAKSKVLPTVVADSDPNRPHFKGTTDAADNSEPAKKQDDAKSNPRASPHASDDDDKPTLKRRSSDSTTSPGSGGTQSSAPKDSSGDAKTQSDDPERPRLRKRKGEPAAPQDSVTAINRTDPDRPKLRRGTPQTLIRADHLTGNPPNLQQMVAVSDDTYREPHPYAFEWANPEDAEKMQAALEQIARESLSSKGNSPVRAATPAAAGASQRSTVSHHAGGRPGKKQPIRSSQSGSTGPLLIDQQFKAFSLDYAGGATLIFSARTSDEVAPVRYVTLIAQPDFYGAPKVVFKQVTDANHLDMTPRLRLIDAVDTDGDNRAELIFEQRGRSDRQFAIYSVRSNRAALVFATGSLP